MLLVTIGLLGRAFPLSVPTFFFFFSFRFKIKILLYPNLSVCVCVCVCLCVKLFLGDLNLDPYPPLPKVPQKFYTYRVTITLKMRGNKSQLLNCPNLCTTKKHYE